MTWFNINEKLPEFDRTVLAWGRLEELDDSVPWIAFRNDYGWVTRDVEGQPRLHSVTHWTEITSPFTPPGPDMKPFEESFALFGLGLLGLIAVVLLFLIAYTLLT